MEHRRRAALFRVLVPALFALCGVLGYLQYRWIGEVSRAERDRLRSSLQASLNRLSQDFNSEIAAACRALLPEAAPPEQEIAARFEQWRKSNQPALFARIGIATAEEGEPALRILDPDTGAFKAAEWPAAWQAIRNRLTFRFPPPEWRQQRRRAGLQPANAGTVFEIPLFRMRPPRVGPGEPRAMPPFGRRESEWLVLELNLQTIRETTLPELVRRHLGAEGDYEVAVVTNADPPSVIYQSDPDESAPIDRRADAWANLFEVRFDQILRRRAFSGPGMEEGPGRNSGPGRWRIFVRNRAGSLDTVVARTRLRNLAVTGGVLVLMAASLVVLLRSMRRAQRLAELQMEFVAGVSHELRTPLTVIHTAAYNLRGSLAGNRAQVERYGALIQQESGRLRSLVEQVLRFASTQAGRVIQEQKPLAVETVIDECMSSSAALLDGHTVEKAVERDLPPILGDGTALKQALENLLSNAVKYGSDWIGIFASATTENGRPAVEIRVADHGPGIPKDEQDRIFDPFFRGRRAVRDQVHGSGLGLNLVKKIVEAHGGSIRVKSDAASGTEFILRIPAAPASAST